MSTYQKLRARQKVASARAGIAGAARRMLAAAAIIAHATPLCRFSVGAALPGSRRRVAVVHAV
jgi:hypothetical protein